ncbi:hypothetical protein LUZ62_074712 [Rhynchospora pubera]|uniref:SWIM-type domain-containing protein n=1 Tax=Rhynchospora pubera TaxID=906938 RepID=A0AAV8DCG0_9POAL|nr:hypothetical protein LUZ62_074712 [Rhynchospora pubera]
MRFHGKTFDDNFQPASYAHTIEQCENHLSEIKKASRQAFNYLMKHGLWCRSKFSEVSKVDYVTNNISESFNNWIKDLKDLHVIEMLNQFRRRLMITFDRRRKVLKKLNGKIVPTVMKDLNEKSRCTDVRRMTVSRAGDNCAEVSGTTTIGTAWTQAVEIDKQQCTCRAWQISGKPCTHAIAFICTLRGTRLEDYVHEYYSIERFKLAYEGVINPIVDASRWIKSDPGFTVWPPKMDKRPTGRPRKERIPSCLELVIKQGRVKKQSVT